MASRIARAWVAPAVVVAVLSLALWVGLSAWGWIAGLLVVVLAVSAGVMLSVGHRMWSWRRQRAKGR